MSDEPQVLVCNRLVDMTMMHPQQDDTRHCVKCRHPVGIYPSGQRALKQWPNMAVMCTPCAMITVRPTDKNIPAGTIEEIMQETRESKPVVQQ